LTGDDALRKEIAMSRSYRRNPFCGHTCAKSDKPGKVLANRSLRRHAVVAIRSCLDFDGFIDPIPNDVSSPWDFPKDGKQRVERTSKYFRLVLRK
jgi:hypothetical protein